jgi:hypothetical protein
MTKKGRRPHNHPESLTQPPPGATLDRYEASMMLMIASRVLEAYDDRDRTQRIDMERRSRRIQKP